MYVNKKTKVFKKYKEVYGSLKAAEKPKKSKELKIDLSEDEYNISAQNEKLCIKLNKEQNLRQSKMSKKFPEPFAPLYKIESKSEKFGHSYSNSDSHALHFSVYSNLANTEQLNTPLNCNPLDGSMMEDLATHINKESNSMIIRKTDTNTDKPPPLTCPNDKPSHNYFLVEKPILYSPQNLSTLIFNPQKKTNARVAMTLNFLRDKLGSDRFNKIQARFNAKGLDRDYIAELLKPSEKDFIKIIEYAFNEQSPSTRGSESFEVNSPELQYK